MIQVKICGLTSPDQAAVCAQLGAAAIGFVFYPPSPRHVEDSQAREISRALPPAVARVGVFVNEGYEFIMGKVEHCGLTMVQLHGQETPELVSRIEGQGVRVMKAFFVNKAPGFDAIVSYPASACLVECAGEKLPGGNAKAWAWREARGVGGAMPLALAGGLDPDNAARAIRDAQPGALDVSSGVEAAPGIKDLDKVKRFLETVSQTEITHTARRVFS